MSATSILPETVTLTKADLRKIIKGACVRAHYLAVPDDIPAWNSEPYNRIADKYVIIAELWAEFGTLPDIIVPSKKRARAS